MSKPILLYNPIFSSTAESYTERLLALKDDETSNTWLNSPGGSVFAGWSIIGAMQLRKGENNGQVMGNASSMAFFMTLFMDRVEALEVSTFLIHRADGYVSTDEDKKFLADVNVQLRAKFEKRINAELFKEVTGVSVDEIFSMDGRKDVYITAKQAKKIGLVDKIIRLETKQIEALTNEFMALGDFEAQGSESETQGSVEVEKPIIDKQIKSDKMDLKTLNAEHPEIVAQIVAKEKDRVNAYMAFSHIDLEACKKGIESGENPSQTFFAEMTVKGMSVMAEKNAVQDSPEVIDTPVVEPTAQTADELELKKLEAEAFTSAKIEGKETK